MLIKLYILFTAKVLIILFYNERRMESEPQKNPTKIQPNSKIYDKFGKYYDLLYDKYIDYKLDCDFFENVFKRHYNNASRKLNLLDLGCGTGNHSIEFARRGYNVTSLDSSYTCIESAITKVSEEQKLPGSVEFLIKDLRSIDINQEFEVVLAIFGVISYIPESDDLTAIFSRIRNSIKSNGLFLGEIWHKPGVPDEFEFTSNSSDISEELEFSRIAKGKRLEGTNSYKVNMEFTLRNVKKDKIIEDFTEIHYLRAFELDEFKNLLGPAGFEILDFLDADGKNYAFNKVNPKTFRAFFIARAV